MWSTSVDVLKSYPYAHDSEEVAGNIKHIINYLSLCYISKPEPILDKINVQNNIYDKDSLALSSVYITVIVQSSTTITVARLATIRVF